LAKNKLNPNNIPFIHNYCDRWCERCTFTSRCAVAEMESKLKPEQLDINNKAFWENIAKNFADAMVMLVKEAKKHGIDMEKFTEEEQSETHKLRKISRQKAENNQLIKLSKAYGNAAMKFLKDKPTFQDKENEIQSHVDLGIKTITDANSESTTIVDCFEIINWYCLFIQVKFMRALPDEMDDDDYASDLQIDNNGSAKIALIAVDRSIMAWQKLYDLMPNIEDLAINQLATLQKIQKLGEKYFPNARRFVRPGFDG
jgi:hypothetical protein